MQIELIKQTDPDSSIWYHVKINGSVEFSRRDEKEARAFFDACGRPAETELLDSKIIPDRNEPSK